MEGAKTLVAGHHAVFPDIHFAIEQQVAAGDTVVSYWRCTGAHRGELMGVAPTGKAVNIVGISILRLAGGKVAKQTTVWDTPGLLQQIDAAPVPA